jgi:hypothetical protein
MKTIDNEENKVYQIDENLFFGTQDLLTTKIAEKYKTLARYNTSISVQNLTYLKI